MKTENCGNCGELQLPAVCVGDNGTIHNGFPHLIAIICYFSAKIKTLASLICLENGNLFSPVNSSPKLGRLLR